VFLGGGLPRLEPSNLQGLFQTPWLDLLSTAGFVYISYVGVTKVASLSEEVRDPEKNLPRGVFLALGTALLIYGLGTLVMVGVVPMDELAGDLTPVATAASKVFGGWGAALISVAAIFAFTSVANAGTLSASRYPLAMSRDGLMPSFFRRLSRQRTPVRAVATTVGLIVVMLLLLEPAKIAKLASAFQLLMFALVCLAVIVMRESQIEAYDPGYRSPLYPWMQVFGLLVPFVLIALMGWLSILFSVALMATAVIWYRAFARPRVSRSGALFHLLARLAEQRMDTGLEQELRLIMREKGLRDHDPFDEVVANARVIDLEDEAAEISFEAVVEAAAEELASRLPATREELTSGFLEGTRIGATTVTKGVSLPHLRLFGIEEPEMVLVRSRSGVMVDVTDVHGEHSPPEPIYSLFFLVSPEESPRQHLRILAQLAERVDEDSFLDEWRSARNEQVLKEILLRDERFLSLRLAQDGSGTELIGRRLRELEMPEGSLVALIRRRGVVVVPRGSTVLEEGDRLTIIGEATHIRALKRSYVR
ncbi:MAG: amino acid permease, partial [Acidobacteria bacterium]|nr:amino acid permease [Acidobacteriota bacterium]